MWIPNFGSGVAPAISSSVGETSPISGLTVSKVCGTHRFAHQLGCSCGTSATARLAPRLLDPLHHLDQQLPGRERARGVVVIVAGLTFFPALALGPLAEGL